MLYEDVHLLVHVALLGVNGKVWTVGAITLTGEDGIPRRKTCLGATLPTENSRGLTLD